jgi:hypothetical protein
LGLLAELCCFVLYRRGIKANHDCPTTRGCLFSLNPFLIGFRLASSSSAQAQSLLSSARRLGSWSRLLGMCSDSRCARSNVPFCSSSRPIRNGVRIFAHQLRDWLRNHGLHLACFCPLVSEVPGLSASCQIVNGRNGSVKAFCTDYPPKCGFYRDFL